MKKYIIISLILFTTSISFASVRDIGKEVISNVIKESVDPFELVEVGESISYNDEWGSIYTNVWEDRYESNWNLVEVGESISYNDEWGSIYTNVWEDRYESNWN